MRRRQLKKSLENVTKFKYLEFTTINVAHLKCGNKIYKCGTVRTFGNDFRNFAKFKYLETTHKNVAL